MKKSDELELLNSPKIKYYEAGKLWVEIWIGGDKPLKISEEGKVFTRCADYGAAKGSPLLEWREVPPRNHRTDNHGGFYPLVSIASRVFRVHRLVYLAFNGAIKEGLEIHHIDSNRENNRLDNIMATTHELNMKLMPEREYKPSYRGKLGEEGVKKAFEMMKQGMNNTQIAKFFGVDPSSISRLRTGDRRKKRKSLEDHELL